MTQGSFEAKLTAKRETAAGIYLTVQVQPDDYQAELATLRVGSALMLGWAEIVNTEVEPIPAPYIPEPPTVTLTAAKERRPFSSLPLSQQAAIRCQDRSFEAYMLDTYGGHDDSIRDRVCRLCAINSRAQLDDETNGVARRLWASMEAEYQSWLTDQKYVGARR